ncbi:MAG TPA: 2,3-diaminopropionate biosynthesis protein SbnA [Amycolatopsis sp.]|uniref:2,3-diaminopropionate biosynthesis protein SbnA n=1 Tax=Amycolatopsis sp. TaxID=37632 RepID=UPI002B49627B|nr:2,3-diaminopropionate biosynthesis protein SbnA [Amycolatopsis sp.]HKS47175.1 2,3-diaminopropionate biosynthesis protein SbnA [Amycolatopsis sp.]
MPTISIPEELNLDDIYVDLRPMFKYPLFLKCETFNFAGSIKLKAAASMLTDAEESGILRPGSVLVESSSGNLGIALAMLAASRDYDFLCVTDVRANRSACRLIETLGGRVHVVTEPDPDGGLLGARIGYIERLCSRDSGYVWLDQYRNPANWKAHYSLTAPAIDGRFPDLDVLFVGAGTTGTLMGCARYFRERVRERRVTMVAVDSVGSTTFGSQAGDRMIPGIGSSVSPPLLDRSCVDDFVLVSELDTIRQCHELASRGFVFGGSTGTVVTGALRWLTENRQNEDVTAVAIAHDLGERYLDTLYDPTWVLETYGSDALCAIREGEENSGMPAFGRAGSLVVPASYGA